MLEQYSTDKANTTLVFLSIMVISETKGGMNKMINTTTEMTRVKYRDARERACYNIFDIEFSLKTFAWEGCIWCLRDMPDITKAEEILIEYYLNLHREKQVYDVVD
jgi:hypothetical protein